MSKNDVLVFFDKQDVIEHIMEQVSKEGQALTINKKEIEEIVNLAIEVNPPTEEKLHYMEMITLNSSFDKGVSRKVGNIVVNWKKIVSQLPSIIGSLGTSKIEIILFVVTAIQAVYDSISIKLSESQVLVIMSLIQINACGYYKNENEVRDKFEELAQIHNLSQKYINKFIEVCNELDRIGCITIEEGKIKLVEKYVVNY